jgi:hypothetical protein
MFGRVQSSPAEPRTRPGLALLGATALPAVYLWIGVGRGVSARFDYPSLSHRDPVQLLFLWGEHLRLSSEGGPPLEAKQARQRFDDSVIELKEELASYKRIAPHAGAAREPRLKDDFGALTVVTGGWGDASARERLEHEDVPDYAELQRNAVLQGRSERDLVRAERIRFCERARRWVEWFEIGLAGPTTFLLSRSTKSRGSVAVGPVPIGLVWAVLLWTWCEAAVQLVGVATGRDVPLLAAFHPASRLIAIPLVLALIRGLWGSGQETLVRMRRLPVLLLAPWRCNRRARRFLMRPSFLDAAAA